MLVYKTVLFEYFLSLVHWFWGHTSVDTFYWQNEIGTNSLPIFNFYRCMYEWAEQPCLQQKSRDKQKSCCTRSWGPWRSTSLYIKSHSTLSSKITTMLLLTDNMLKFSIKFAETKEPATAATHSQYWLHVSECFLLLVPKRFLQPKAMHHNKIGETREIFLWENGRTLDQRADLF